MSEKIVAQYEKRPRTWLTNLGILAVLGMVILWSSGSLNFKGLAEQGIAVANGVAWGLTHPDTSLLFTTSTTGVPYLLLQTVAIALLGTLCGAILAVPFSFLASSNIVPKPLAAITRTLILLIRTIPSLVWALVWIRVTGPGPFCGVLTQSVCSIGMISKMYITAIEDLDMRIIESLDAAGCTTFQKIRYGVLPQLIPNFISSTVYRFDINLKDATTLGIVGAGGIGASLVQCLNSRRWSMVGAFIVGLMVLVLFIEYFSTRVRTKLAQGN